MAGDNRVSRPLGFEGIGRLTRSDRLGDSCVARRIALPHSPEAATCVMCTVSRWRELMRVAKRSAVPHASLHPVTFHGTANLGPPQPSRSARCDGAQVAAPGCDLSRRRSGTAPVQRAHLVSVSHLAARFWGGGRVQQVFALDAEAPDGPLVFVEEGAAETLRADARSVGTRRRKGAPKSDQAPVSAGEPSEIHEVVTSFIHSLPHP